MNYLFKLAIKGYVLLGGNVPAVNASQPQEIAAFPPISKSDDKLKALLSHFLRFDEPDLALIDEISAIWKRDSSVLPTIDEAVALLEQDRSINLKHVAAAELLYQTGRYERAKNLFSSASTASIEKEFCDKRLRNIEYLWGNISVKSKQNAYTKTPSIGDAHSSVKAEDKSTPDRFLVMNANNPPYKGVIHKGTSVAIEHIACSGGDSFCGPILREISAFPYKWDRQQHPTINDCLNSTPPEKHPLFLYHHGMYGCHKSLRIPVAYFTILREPTARFISEFYWERRNDPRLPDQQREMIPDLCRYIDSFSQANFQVYSLAQFQDERPNQIPHLRGDFFGSLSIDLAYEIALQRIREMFFFIGITELFEESLFLFFDAMELPGITPWQQFSHASGRGSNQKKVSINDLPDMYQQKLRNLLDADIELYAMRKKVIVDLFAASDFGTEFDRYKAYHRQPHQ